MDICKFKGTPYYKAISDALVSGNIQVPSEDFTYKDMTIEEYFSGDMISNGELLSKDDKASLLNSIQRDLEKENILTSEVKEKIEEIKTVLDLSKETIVKSKVVKVPSIDVSKLNLFRIPLSKSGRLLDISTTERGKLIPILNLELNNYVTSTILSSLKEVCLWNENKKLIIADNRELTESILTYRNSLIKVLNNFVGTNVSLPIGNNLSELDIEEYNNLLQSSWDAIKNILYRFNGEINVAYDENTASTLVNPIMAFYVLLNFDKVLSTFLSDFITTNPGEYGNINSSDEKYKKKASRRLNSSYNDDINNSSGENLLDSILDTFITSTQKSDGTYLDKKFKENLLCVLRDAVENKRIRKNEVTSEQKLIDSLLSILSNEGNSADDKVNALINLLGTTNSITEKLGADSCKKLSQRLKDFLDAINRKKGTSTSKQWANIDNEYNVGYRLINHIANKGVVGITSITGATSTNSITPGTKEKSKQYVKGRLTTALADTLGSNRRLLTSEMPLLLGRVSAEGVTDLYSERAQDILSKITGLNFRDKSVIEKFSTEENLQKLANFLNAYRNIVREMYPGLASSLVNDRTGVAEEMMKKIVTSGAYIDFSDIFVEENEFELQRMFDLQGKEQARTTIATLSTQFTQCFSDFKKYMGQRPNRNILVRFPGISKLSEASFDLKGTLERTSAFALYITFLGDCKFKNGDAVRWIKQRPNEVNTAYLNQLYLFNVLDNNMLSFLIDVTSDKMKTPLANLNLQSFNFVRQPLQTLKQLKQDQLQDYYNRIREQIFDFFERILGVRYNTLEELDKAILNVNPDSIIEKVRLELRKGDLEFTYQPEIFFSTANGKLLLNRSLCYEMFKCDSPALQEEYDAMVLEHYKQTLIEQGIKLNLTSAYIDELDYDLKLSLVSMFFDDPSNDINKACDKIKEILRTDSTFNNPELEYFLSKFITLQNITRESAIQIFNKHYWVHGKSAGDVSLSDLKITPVNLESIDPKEYEQEKHRQELHTQALHDLISNEMKKRIEKSTKRNNSQSATFAPMDLGIKHGVPDTIRVASIASLNKTLYNNFGNKTDDPIHTHDGAIWSAHILRIWERNSQTQMYMANSAKIIALQPNGAGFYQIKCADYSMTNEWIRNSISQADSNSDQFVDGRHLYKLMLSPAKTEQLLKNLLYDDTALLNLGLGLGRSNFNVFYDFQGKLAKLEDIEVSTDLSGNVTLVPTWLYTDGEEVPNNIVAETFSLVQDTYSDGLYVKDLYDLWNFFGAELSQSINELGTIDYSDISLEYVAYLVSEYSPELKSQMISKICDPESVKSTAFPINSREDVYNRGKDLASVNIRTRYYGPQQDYSHETDEDTIPFTTQVIGAIAFNGENSELVQDLYETIGQITAEALAEITELSDLSNKTKLYKKIGKLVANNLSANGIISNAASILLDSLRTLIDNDEVFAKKALPLSDNQLYHAATAQILSKLNKMIKLRFAGTAVILNPALGIIGVYLDADGITYNKSTIIKKALEWYNSNSLSGLTRTQDIVDAYLNREEDDNTFRNRSVFGRYTDSEGNELVLNDLHLLNIADNVLVYASKESLALYQELYNALKETDNPYIYNLEIQDPIVLYQLVNAVDSNLVSGVLKVYNKPRNLATTQITFLDVNGKNTNFWLLLSTQAIIADKSEGISEAKWWLHENRKGIGDKEKPYYYATLEDFKNKIPTYIVKDSIVYKGGEEVLPKQYKRKYSVNGSLSDIFELNLKYFRDLAQYRMKADPKINLDEFGKRSFVISTNDYDIIFAEPGTQVGENVTLEKTEQYYRLYTEDDELIPNIKLPIDHNYSVQYVTGEKPQLIIVPSEDITTNTRFAETFLNAVHANSARFNSESPTYAEAFAVLDESLISQDKIEELANLLLTSFKLTLKTVSVRIPSQSFQSFLSNETVLFTESDDNNGYMNLWEMWFQGSDFDIRFY